MEMKMKELLAHLGEAITVKGNHYNGLNGRYILSGITQTVEKTDGTRKWKNVLHLTEPDNGKVSYQIDPYRYEITVGDETTVTPPTTADRIRSLQAEIREKIQNCSAEKPPP